MSRSIRAGFLIATVCALLAPTASHADAGDDVAQYALDRLYDFADIFRLRVGTPQDGKGYGAKARATALAQVGYVHFNGKYAGMDRRGIGVVREKRTEGGLSLLYGSNHKMETVAGNGFLDEDTLWSTIEDRRLVRNLPYWDDGRGDLLSLNAEIATPILAVDAAIHPSQLLDFVTGFFLIDPFNDDEIFIEKEHPAELREPSTLPEPDLEAATRRKAAELDAIRARIVREQMEASGQLDESDEGDQAVPLDRTRLRSSEAETVLPDEDEFDYGVESAPQMDDEVEVIETDADVNIIESDDGAPPRNDQPRRSEY